MSWNVLKHIVQQDKSLDAFSTLGRSVDGFETYKTFKREVIFKDYASVLDYAMITIFGCGSTNNSGTMLYHVLFLYHLPYHVFCCFVFYCLVFFCFVFFCFVFFCLVVSYRIMIYINSLYDSIALYHCKGKQKAKRCM